VSEYSEEPSEKDMRMNDVRPLIDETDRRILEVLAMQAPITDNELADRDGIADRMPGAMFGPW
jgi:hypothetical protein